MRMSRFGLVTAALAVTVSAPAYAADLYGGTIIRKSIQDIADNYTRFFLLSVSKGTKS